METGTDILGETRFEDWVGELSRLRQAARAEAGLYAGKPLNGYQRVAGRDVHVVDEAKRKAVRRLFREAPRKSFRELLKVAEEEGLENSSGGKLGLSSLHNMLSNPFYAGLVRSGDRLVSGRHEAIVTLKDFEQMRNAMRKRQR